LGGTTGCCQCRLTAPTPGTGLRLGRLGVAVLSPMRRAVFRQQADGAPRALASEAPPVCAVRAVRRSLKPSCTHPPSRHLGLQYAQSGRIARSHTLQMTHSQPVQAKGSMVCVAPAAIPQIAFTRASSQSRGAARPSFSRVQDEGRDSSHPLDSSPVSLLRQIHGN